MKFFIKCIGDVRERAHVLGYGATLSEKEWVTTIIRIEAPSEEEALRRLKDLGFQPENSA